MKAENEYKLGKIAEAGKITKDGIDILEKDSDLLLQQQTSLVVSWFDMLYRVGEEAKAIKFIERAEHKLDQSGGGLWLSELYVAEAKMYFAGEKYEKAIVVLDNALKALHKTNEKKPNALMAEILYFKALCCYRLKHLPQAKVLIDEAESSCPEDLSAIRAKCHTLRQEIVGAATAGK
jgi:tetratricopeptide (TPR) repeat protein